MRRVDARAGQVDQTATHFLSRCTSISIRGGRSDHRIERVSPSHPGKRQLQLIKQQEYEERVSSGEWRLAQQYPTGSRTRNSAIAIRQIQTCRTLAINSRARGVRFLSPEQNGSSKTKS
jgi:hypothetical protein